MKNDYETRAKKFIEEFFADIPDMKEALKIYGFFKWYTKKYNEEHHRHVKVESGYTRVVFITSDYVVKVDYKKGTFAGTSYKELCFYNKAKKDGMEYLFAKPTRYRFNGFSFYIMPRVTGIHPNSYRYADEYMSAKEYEWVQSHGLRDLHQHNYGVVNGHPVIFDYACYD